jgi:hypothetical protein
MASSTRRTAPPDEVMPPRREDAGTAPRAAAHARSVAIACPRASAARVGAGPFGRSESRTPAGPCDRARGCGTHARAARLRGAAARPAASVADSREGGLTSPCSAQQKRRKVRPIARIAETAVALKLLATRLHAVPSARPRIDAGIDVRAGQPRRAEVASAPAAGAPNAKIDDCTASPVHHIFELTRRHVTIVLSDRRGDETLAVSVRTPARSPARCATSTKPGGRRAESRGGRG